MIAFNAIHAEITWTLSDDGTLTISGTDMPDYYEDIYVPWFLRRDKIKKVLIENEVTSIGNYAFNYCRNLTSITIPNSVTSIGLNAFYRCSGLTSITIPNSVTSIKSSAFKGCSGLNYVTIPNSVTSIEWNAFEGCSGLTSITIPNSVTSIKGSAFRGCSGLNSVTIPNSVTSIGDLAFSECSGLSSITVEQGNKKYDSRNCNAIIEKETNTLIAGCKKTVIPNTVTSIGGAAFNGCSDLTSVTIPNSVTSIGGGAFRSCSGLTSVTIPNSVTSIEDCTFIDCSGLTSITIPESVTSIGSQAFWRCSSLTSITNLATTPQIINSWTFSQYGTLHVLPGCKAKYEAADYWKNFTIEEDATTGIDAVEGTSPISTDKIFSISGQQLDKTKKGVNIINGKKILVK